MPIESRRFSLRAATGLIALVFPCLAWDLWLAPLRPGGSWLASKVLPLLTVPFGLLRGRRRAHQWASLLALPCFPERVTRTATSA